MNTFKVWDPLNADEAEAESIEARTPLAAAETYARADEDGITDGIYQDGHAIDVRDEDGLAWRYDLAWVDHPAAWWDRAGAGAELRAVRFLGEGGGAL